MFDYLSPHNGPVIVGLEQFENVYAKNQPQYNPLRTLPGENGDSAIARFHLTEAQRKAVAEGADIYLEILHYKGPLAPTRMMVLSEPPDQEGARNLARWWKAQTKGTYDVSHLDDRKVEPRLGIVEFDDLGAGVVIDDDI